MAQVKPKVIVFDLDYTLWPFWVGTHIIPPFQRTNKGIMDSLHAIVTHYPEAYDILSSLHKQGYNLSVASRTEEIEGARRLIGMFCFSNYFSHEQIYPGSKTQHITKIKEAFGVEFEDMMLFDAEERNVTEVSELGVFSILVRKGVTKRKVEDALKRYSSQKPRS